jgi:hypothetical protein
MKADHKVTSISLSDVPAVIIYESDRGNRVAVLIVPVRTDYYESDEDAIRRAGRIAHQLTTPLALKKEGSINHSQENQSHGNSST